jgi:hypothetical protein
LPAPAAVLVVTSTADSGAGTLRNAVASANPGDTIIFASTLSGQTILLTSGVIEINQNVTIDGSTLTNSININGNGTSKVFDVNNVTVVLNALTLTNAANLATGPNETSGWGGAIFCSGTLTLNQCQLVNNTAQLAAAIFNQGGILTLNQCRVLGNSCVQDGVIYNWSYGTVILTGSTFSGNVANSGWGGGVLLNDSTSSAMLTQCTLFGNSGTGSGGAIFNTEGSTLTVVSCTITGNTNTTGYGGGINNDSATSTLFMTNSIVAGNTAAAGADIYNLDQASAILGGSNLVQDVYGAVTGGYLNAAPQLATLGSYGGPTPAMPPLPGSPAIGAGSDFITNFLATDQRGFPRKVGAHVDIGAVEVQLPAANPPVLKNAVWAATGGGRFQFAFTNVAVADFTVLTTTNVALPLANWMVLGNVPQLARGQYQITDLGATNTSKQFYRVVSP